MEKEQVMKKELLVFVIMVMMIGVAADASQVRLLTMGENYDVVKDDDNIWLFPSTINYYPDMVIGEINGGNFSKAGTHWKLGDMMFATYFNKNGYGISIPDPSGTVGGWSTNMDQHIDLFVGMEVAGVMGGARLSYWGEGVKRENDPQILNTGSFDPYGLDHTNFDDSYRRVEFAFGASTMDGKADVSVQIGLNSWTEERNYAYGIGAAAGDTTFTLYDETSADGCLDFSIMGRYFHEYNSDWTLVPHFAFSSGKNGLIAQDVLGVDTNSDGFDDRFDVWDAAEAESKMTSITLGVGTNFQASENVMTVTDMGLMIQKTTDELTLNVPAGVTGVNPETYKQEDKPVYLPYFKFGLDAELRSWLDLRVGAVSQWCSTEETYEDNIVRGSTSVTESGVTTTTYLGAGFHWDDLTIDACIEPGFLNNGPNFITGNTTGGWATQVALLYNFGK